MESKDFINIDFPRILGPVRIIEYKDDKRHIYFFGDAHVIKPVCWPEAKYKTIEIQDFIQDIVNENKDDIIDLFVETQSIDKDIIGDNNWIDRIVKKFFLETKNANLRAHYVDVRREDKMAQLKAITNIIWSFLYAIQSNFTVMAPVITNSDLEEAKKQFGEEMLNSLKGRKMIFFLYLKKYIKNLKLTKNNFLDIISNPNNILTQAKYFKQVENIEDENEREFILKYFNDRLEKEIKNEKKAIRFIKMLFSSYDEKIKEQDYFSSMSYKDINLACRAITLRNMEFMDAYTLSRMLRSYKDAKRGDKILVYAGNDHINNYIDFFLDMEGEDKILNVSESRTQGYDYQCINISKFKLPFFS